jgi:FlaG/FlaF family flagellin (archaellin)
MRINKKKLLHLYFKGENISKKRTNKAVSEIIATILLLSISLSLLCIVYVLVLNNATSPSSTYHVSSAQIIATADEKNIFLQNNGGVPLSLNTKLVITVGGQDFFVTAEDCVVDSNGDGMWSIGEQIKFTPPTIASLFGLEIQIKIINPDTNSMIMAGLVQEGARGDQPYVQTLNPYDVWPHSATMKSYYNFVKVNYLPGKLWFQWKRSDDPLWNRTPMLNITAAPLSGFYQFTLYNLTSNKNYLCEAWIQYTSGTLTFNQSGGIKLFTTQIDAMGIWHFDESSGIKLFDSSGQFPPNDGILTPNEIRGPQRLNAELNHSTKSLNFDGIDDYGQVANSNTLSVTNECTIEAWINRSEHSDGLVGTPLQSSLSQFGNYTLGCYDPYIIHVNGDIYALVSTNENSLGYLGTINITDAGDIKKNPSTSSCYLDLFNFEASCKTPKIIQVNVINGIVAIVYTKPSVGNQLYIKTVQIFNDGRINKTVINTRVLDAGLSSTPDIIYKSNNVYAIVYGITAVNTGVLISINISNLGTISPVNKKLIFGDIMIEPEIIKVVDSFDIYVIVYNCIGDDGGLRTVKITNTGLLSDISFHVWFDDDDGGSPEIINVHDDIYAIVYAGPILRQSGFLKTIEILSNGDITLSRTIPPLAKAFDQIAFEMSAGNSIRYPHILRLHGANDFYGISYSIDSPTANLWGKIVTIMILDNGNIVSFSKKDVTFEPFLCSASYFIPIHDEIYGIVYRGEAGDGIIKIIWIHDDGHIHNNPILDMEEIGGLKCYADDEILTSDSRYVADVFRGVNSKLVLKTVKVNTTSKTIANTFTDSFTIELGYTSTNGTFNASYTPTIIPINNDVYAIAYCQYLTSPVHHDGKMVTVKINAAGHITLIERYTFDADCMNTPFSFIPINKSNGFYAVAYQMYSTSQGKVKTIKIGSNGHIFGVQDSYIFDNLFRCREPSMSLVSGDVYTIIYRDSLTSSTYGRLVTLKIYGSNGTIKKSVIDSWTFTTSCYHPTIIKVDSNIFTCVFSVYDGGAWRYIAYVTTVKIADNGIISKTWIDYLEFIRRYYTDNYLSHHPKIIKVYDRVYAIISNDLPDPWNAYQYNGWISTLRIGENGDIIDAVDGATQISTSPRITSYDIKMIPFVNDSYIAIYGGKNNDLYQCVIRIPLSETNRTILSKSGSYVVKANKTKVFVTFTDSNNIPYTLSAPLKNNWNYIVTTYDKTTMNLYINANLNGSLALGSKPIKVTTNQLYFGLYNGYYDEFSLYAAILSPAKIIQNYNYYRPP